MVATTPSAPPSHLADGWAAEDRIQQLHVVPEGQAVHQEVPLPWKKERMKNKKGRHADTRE